MLRKGRWKLHYYVGYPPELFDLENDPEETSDLAANADHSAVLDRMEAELRQICDPEAMDGLAKKDQAALVTRHGGRGNAINVGAPGATPPPSPAKVS